MAEANARGMFEDNLETSFSGEILSTALLAWFANCVWVVVVALSQRVKPEDLLVQP